MTKEGKVLILSMIINFIVSAMKVIAGVLCSSNSMIADGFHSLSDFITDIVAIFGSKVSNKKADKHHPDGYGRFEYITDMFIALVIFILGFFTIYNSFAHPTFSTNIVWIIIVILTIALKYYNSKNLMKKGIEYHSPILITSSHESKDDVISSLGVILIIILMQFQNTFPILKYADTLGSLIIGMIILHTAFTLMKENILSLLGEIEENKDVEEKISSIVNEYKEIRYKDLELERHGSYYVLELDVYVVENIKVYKLLTIESEIRKKIKKLNLRIKFIDINLSHKEKTTT